MSLLVVGSVAYDSVKTPYGKVDNALGGSAVYFSVAASFFTKPVRLVGVVGKDFAARHIRFLEAAGVDTRGLERSSGSTFRWAGRYEGAMNEATTLETHLNVFGEFDPKIPDGWKASEFVFLANGVPSVQEKVLSRVRKPRFVLLDTMNLWIANTRKDLARLLKKVDGIVLNDGEARMLTADDNLVRASKAILRMGPKVVILKKGEHGSMMTTKDDFFALPAYPAEKVKDPTGAGDSFAGGVMGYLASRKKVDRKSIRAAMLAGTMMASFNIEDFSLRRFARLKKSEIDRRRKQFEKMLRLE